ncbi:hypothetical protein MMC22_007503 [Lobaria immixta]|nr:hypothetical protein [Lobaria immixta]
MASHMPSAAQLPSVWNKEMDRFICHCEAIGEVDTSITVRGLKRKFPELARYVITPEAIDRRVFMLEMGDNDYFKEGMETAVARAEAAGFVLPPMDFEKYARKPKEEVEATEPATTADEAGSDSKSKMVGNEDDQAGGEGSAQLPSGGVLGTDGANEKQKSVEAPAPAPARTTSSSGRKPDLKAMMKAKLGIGKENNPGASSSRGNDQELQSRGAPSSRPGDN